MSKHTPGPWSVAPRIGRYQVIPASEQERYQLARIKALEFDALSVGTPKGQVAMIPLDESNLSNANLIAAAPDLLEALEAAIECGIVPSSTAKNGGATRHARQVIVADMIREAIAKARGEA